MVVLKLLPKLLEKPDLNSKHKLESSEFSGSEAKCDTSVTGYRIMKRTDKGDFKNG